MYLSVLTKFVIQNALRRNSLFGVDVDHLREEVHETGSFRHLVVVEPLQSLRDITQELFLGLHYVCIASIFAAQDSLTNFWFTVSCGHFTFQGKPDLVTCDYFYQYDSQRPNVM